MSDQSLDSGRLERLAALSALGSIQNPNLDKRINRMLDVLLTLSGAAVTGIYWVQSDKTVHQKCHGRGTIALTPDDPLVKAAFKQNDRLVAVNMEADKRYAISAMVKMPPHVKTVITEPVRNLAGRMLGFIYVGLLSPEKPSDQAAAAAHQLVSWAELELRVHLLARNQRKVVQDMLNSGATAKLDDLTLLWNHQAIVELARRELEIAKRGPHPIGLMLIEVDDFNLLATTRGEMITDSVNREVAKRIQSALRPTDALGRYNERAFLAVLVNAETMHLGTVAERIHEAVATSPVHTPDRAVNVSVCSGTGFTGPKNFVNVDALLGTATDSLMIARESGTNRRHYEEAKPERG